MPYDPNRHHRRSIRLRGYDYTQPGAYFVTICAHERQYIFDSPELRRIAEEQWLALARSGQRGAAAGRVALDAWVVMPNHIHGIIVIAPPFDVEVRPSPPFDVGAQQMPPSSTPHNSIGASAAPLRDASPRDASPRDASPPGGLGINVAPGSLAAIVRSYKSAVARRINRLRRTPGEPVWQRGYYEHIIRTDASLSRIRCYIAENPARWLADPDSLDALLARMDARE